MIKTFATWAPTVRNLDFCSLCNREVIKCTTALTPICCFLSLFSSAVKTKETDKGEVCERECRGRKQLREVGFIDLKGWTPLRVSEMKSNQ
jgi:hypothetical protein